LDCLLVACVAPNQRLPSLGQRARMISCLAGLAGVCLLAGCGAQSPPQPPRHEHPERITDLKVAQVGRRFELTFTPPVRALDGQRLTKPLEIEIYRTQTPPGQAPSAARPPSNLLTSLLITDVTRYARDQQFTCPVTLTGEEFQRGQGSLFTFQLRALTRGFRRRPLLSEFSNLAQTALLDVSGPAEDMRARATAKGIELQWNPPTKGPSGRESSVPTGWRIYQSRKTEKDSFKLLGETSTRDYLVRDIEYDRPYIFKVRAVFRQGQWVAESEDSPVVEVTPRDTFPPAAPEGLSAIYTAGAVELIWTASTEPDLGGYNIYRRAEDGRWQKVNSEIQRTPLYRDSTAAPEKRYFYRATALDLANNESDPSVEIAVETK
jgi:hypothetical protein